MNLQESPIPNGIESQFILSTKPNDCTCNNCQSNNTFLNFNGVTLKYYACRDCGNVTPIFK